MSKWKDDGKIELDQNPKTRVSKQPDAHYKQTFKGIKLDPYRVLDVYGITHPAQQHAIKKLLRAGKSVKTQRQDVEEVILSLQRWLQMMAEDEQRQTET